MRSNITELPDISLSGIYKTYGCLDNITYALNNINLDVVKGEFLVLCGPSGSGKSTLLNILSGIDMPTAGHVFFLHKNLNALSEKNLAHLRSRHLGFIFQFFNLIPVLSVFDNVYYPLTLNGHFNAKEARERTLHFLDSVGLSHLLARKPGQLSGGQQQRVAIARALRIVLKLLLLTNLPVTWIWLPVNRFWTSWLRLISERKQLLLSQHIRLNLKIAQDGAWKLRMEQ